MVLLQDQFKNNDINIYAETGISFNRKSFKQLLFDCGLNEKKLKDGILTQNIKGIMLEINLIVLIYLLKVKLNMLRKRHLDSRDFLY